MNHVTQCLENWVSVWNTGPGSIPCNEVQGKVLDLFIIIQDTGPVQFTGDWKKNKTKEYKNQQKGKYHLHFVKKEKMLRLRQNSPLFLPYYCMDNGGISDFFIFGNEVAYFLQKRFGGKIYGSKP